MTKTKKPAPPVDYGVDPPSPVAINGEGPTGAEREAGRRASAGPQPGLGRAKTLADAGK